jgi:hypothetical protein
MGNGVVAHWNGHTWTRNTALEKVLPVASSTVFVQLMEINAVSRGNVSIAAEIYTQSGQTTKISKLLLHLSGGTWHKVAPGSAGYYLATAVPDGHGGWWAEQPFTFSPGPFLWHRAKGKTHWTRVALSVPHGDHAFLGGLARVPGSTAMVALLGVSNGTPALKTEVLVYGKLPK